MTREELKEHCLKQIEMCEFWARGKGEKPSGKVYEEHKLILELLEQEPCEDVISRKSIKQKLQEHHDFFVNAYGGFSNLPQNDKSRVDEITNCIAMVVNEPPITPQEPRKGHWIVQPSNKEQGERDFIWWKCSECGQVIFSETEHDRLEFHAFCGRCGAKMVEPQESEDKE